MMNLYLYKIEFLDPHDEVIETCGFTFGENFVEAMRNLAACYQEALVEVKYIKELDACTDVPVYEVNESILEAIENDDCY
ncbi:MAG: hypothetical protein Q4E51_08665 [Lachnospiraceae bacterium]|nr:hypothetical protein [Lachnospiraceae bacterium]